MVVLLVVTALVVALLIRASLYRYNDPLRKFPGPYWASWTYLWRLKDFATGMPRIPTAVQLHRKYGDVVRTGPNVLNFSSPQAVKDIYGTDKPYPKSDWYLTFAATSQGNVLQTLFATADTDWHDSLRRAVSPAFSLSALVSYEPFVDNTISEFLAQLEARFAPSPSSNRAGDPIDLARWMHWYAFDVVGELTYGRAFGFLRTGSDVEHIIRDSNAFMSSNMVASGLPGLDGLLRKNPALLWLNRHGWLQGAPNPVVAFALRNRAGRTPDGRRLDAPDDGRADLLRRFIEAKLRSPDTVSEREVLSVSLSMIFAGSESTGTTLTALFYHLLRDPGSYARLRKEIDEELPLAVAGETTASPVPFARARGLGFLDACVRETFRLHPAARFAPERVLPPGGARIDGRDVPGGTVVGVNAWALHRREDAFGEAPDEFRPERWLPRDGSAAEAERVEAMARRLFHFGAGRFVCIGRNISLLEVYKVVPSLMRRFDFELVDPAREWRFVKGGFVNIADVDVRIRVRGG